MTDETKDTKETEVMVKLKSGNVSVDGVEYLAVKGVFSVPALVAQFLIAEHQAERV